MKIKSNIDIRKITINSHIIRIEKKIIKYAKYSTEVVENFCDNNILIEIQDYFKNKGFNIKIEHCPEYDMDGCISTGEGSNNIYISW